FSLEKVHKAGAVFDLEKLGWFNFQWQKRVHTQKLEHIAREIDPKVDIQETDRGHATYAFTSGSGASRFEEQRAALLLEICGTHIPRDWVGKPFIGRALITVEEKILKSPAEISEQISFYVTAKKFNRDLMLSEKMKVDENVAKTALSESASLLESLDESAFNNMQKLQDELIGLAQKLGLKNGQLLWPLRVALTGEQFSPGVFEVLWVLGKEESIRRVKSLIHE
ncbi:MAG TPA: hypothetical protein VI588_02925, partial [Candidatus Gracilibacteria bacterium]|nr:hypothetical protein [Candidatus Gracilibacteria bacterium]